MADILHCDYRNRAKAYRLASSKPVYRFQIVNHCPKCKRCGSELMRWRGEYPNGNYSDWIAIPKAEFPHWHRRIKAGEAKPEAQMMSEYSQRIGRPADVALYYLSTIERATGRGKDA